MKYVIASITLLLGLVLFFSCDKIINEPVSDAEGPPLITKEKISGHVQKGPYINGSSITLYELDDSLNGTGSSFDSQITDNTGMFQIQNVKLKSKYAKLRADGFYFNEVNEEESGAQLTMYALADLTDISSIKVRFIVTGGQNTHLIEYYENGDTEPTRVKTITVD